MTLGPFSRFTIATAAIATLAACGSATSPAPTRSTTVSVTPPATPAAPSLQPDGLGALKLGMTKAAAAATGLVTADVPSKVCEGTIALQPNAPYTSSFDVLLDQSGKVTAIGVSDARLRTSSGIHIGSTLADVRHAYPSASAPRDPGGDAAAYHQSAVYVQAGNDYLGFLFATRPGAIKASDKVVFMEISHGRPPGLFRDAC